MDLRCTRCWQKESSAQCLYTEGHDFVNEKLWWAIRSRCEIQEPHRHGSIFRKYQHCHDTKGRTLQVLLDMYPYWDWVYVRGAKGHGTTYWKEVKCDKDLDESPYHRVEETPFITWTFDQCPSCQTKFTDFEYR